MSAQRGHIRLSRKQTALCIALSTLALLLIAAAAWYAGSYSRSGETAQAAMAQADASGAHYSFGTGDVGLILYPGGKVEYTAYAPLAGQIAERCGIVCIVPRMPMNLAVLDMDAAADVMEQYPQIGTWYVGGHSLGGAMAASYAAQNPDAFAGVVLLAAYSTEPLSIPVLSVYGEKDTVLDAARYAEYRANLPRGFTEVVIPGGNHAGFGDYGAQDGDTPADIPAQQQRQITADAIADWLNALGR